jgi:hypothetical protein
MKQIASMLLLLLTRCASSWPSGSYVAEISDADARVLAASVTEYLAGALRPGVPVAIPPDGDVLSPVLTADLRRAGIRQDPNGRRVHYVAAPLDDGVMLRISIDNREGASRFFVRSNGSLVVGGPMTVALP